MIGCLRDQRHSPLGSLAEQPLLQDWSERHQLFGGSREGGRVHLPHNAGKGMGKPVRDNIRRNLGEHDQAKQNKRYIEGQYPVHNSFFEWHAKLCHTNRKMPPRKEN
jgi:hypothetical protein